MIDPEMIGRQGLPHQPLSEEQLSAAYWHGYLIGVGSGSVVILIASIAIITWMLR